ncbi:MAG: hypothetical protein ACR2NL_10805 [Acidimicrobiia bacterium]
MSVVRLNLKVGGGNDSLDGGSGDDLLDGRADTDECINGETIVNCEGPI